MPCDRSDGQHPTLQDRSYTVSDKSEKWHESHHAQPAKKVELHPAAVIDPRPIPPRLTEVAGHLGDSIRRSDEEQLVELGSSLATTTTTSMGIDSQSVCFGREEEEPFVSRACCTLS